MAVERPISFPIAPSNVPISQFIIALLLVKSKPSRLATKVYLAHLRLYIRQGTRPKYPTLLHRHIDITTYWRDAYTKSEEDKVALHKDLAESRRINSEREEAKNETPLDTTAQRKRKRDETESIGHLTGSSKKARTTTLRRTMDSPFQALRAILDKPAADLIDQFLELQDIVAKSDPTEKDMDDISDLLLKFSSEVFQHIATVFFFTKNAKEADPLAQESNEKIQNSRLGIIWLSLLCLLKDSDKSIQSIKPIEQESDPDGSNQVVAPTTAQELSSQRFYLLFKTLLERFYHLVKLQAVNLLEEAQSTQLPSFKGSQQCSTTPSVIRPIKVDQVTKHFYSFIFTLSCLNLEDVAYVKILANFGSCLVRRMGLVLKTVNFHENEIVKGLWSNLSKLERIRISITGDSTGGHRANREGEALMLVHLLSILADFSYDFHKSTSPGDILRNCPRQNPAITHAKPQNILLSSIIDEESSIDLEPSLISLGTLPDITLNIPKGPKNNHTKLNDWFLGAIGRFMGYDVLEDIWDFQRMNKKMNEKPFQVS